MHQSPPDASKAPHAEEKPFHLPIEPFQGTPEEIEKQWFEKVYKGRGDSMSQLTWRAVIMGSLLGGVLSLTNLYIGLKTGWGFGVAITACILSYAIWTTLVKLRIARTPMTILENNCMQSTASSAGYSTGGTLISAFAAFIILNNRSMDLGLTLSWVFFLAVLGVTMAVPMKRQMINIDQLRFPSGIAAAETLQALHAHGNSGIRAAQALGVAGVLAALDKFWAEGLELIANWKQRFAVLAEFSSVELIKKAQIGIFGTSYHIWEGRSFVFGWDSLYVAAGAITGMRVCATMLISATLCWGVFVPWLQHTGHPSRLSVAANFKKDEAQARFITTINAANDPVSQFVAAQIPAETKSTLAKPDLALAESKALLIPALNKIIDGPSIYDTNRFAKVELSGETKALLALPAGGCNVAEINRHLLDDAYPGTFAGAGFRGLLQWTLWGGTACMVTSGILAFLLQWQSVLRAFRSLGAIFGRKNTSGDELEAIETPMSWFAIGQGISLIALAILAHKTFGMPYWQSALAVVLSFFLALVACRITGETDTTPIGAMGKVTQLTFGALNPGNVNVNLMAANITAAAAGSSADLLTDLKSGYLLGAHPRKQFLAQFAGIFIGTLVTVLSFSALVRSADVLGSKEFPAPAAQTWAAVARAMSEGLSVLEPVKVWSIVVGGAVGILLVLLPKALPKWQGFLPSAAGLGLAWVFEWNTSLMFFMGAVIGWFIEKKWPKIAKDFTFPVASGVIAGSSLMGVVLIFTKNGADMWNALVPQIKHLIGM